MKSNVKPSVLIFSRYGLNTEEETKFIFESVGAHADIMHINDLIKKPSVFKHYQIAVLPGGFSYGDDTGGGKAYARKLTHHLGDALETFLNRDTLLAGICNGFQIATNADILPGALISNKTPGYLCRWVDVEVVGNSPWLSGIERMSIPIAHGEGRYYDTEKNLDHLEASGAVALRYVQGGISKHFSLPGNPNGSLRDIAGITARDGRVIGMMPHPERAIRFTQEPHWTQKRTGEVKKEGDGVALFRNAVRYFA